MSRVINITSAITLTPASYLSGYTSGITNQTAVVGESCDNTSTYCAFSARTGASVVSYVMYSFDCSSIPSIATINSVACSARTRVSSTSRITGHTQMYRGSTTAMGSAAQISSTANAGAIQNITCGTWTRSQLDNCYIRISATRGTNQTTSARQIRFYGATLVINYTVNGTEYEVSINNQSSDVTTVPVDNAWTFAGGSQEVRFYGIDNLSDISVKDNNTNVTSSLVSYPGANNTASVGTINGVTYGFATSGNGYCSTNQGRASSVSMCRLNITAASQCVLNLYVINYAEATYDYGVIGQLDTALTTVTSTTNDNYAWIGSTSDKNLSTEQLVQINVPSGTHYVDFKFRKDNYTDSYNDSLWFRYELDPSVSDPYYSYTLSNISADHTILIEDVGGTYYNVNASSTYNGATVSPSTLSIREGRNATVNINVANLYEIKVKDNNVDVTSSVTGTSGNYTYTVSNVQTAHTITVEENANYSVTVTSTYTGATGTANPSKVYVGQSSVVEIDVDNLYEIVVKDNGVDVTNSIVEVQGETSSPNFDIIEYVESASTYDSVYSTYYTSNGVAGSGSTTRACVYVTQTAYAEGKLTYKFDCSSIPANATITNVVCFAGAACYSSGRYFDTRTLQLYNGSIAKGTATTITGNGSTKTTHTINGGNWSREELDDISIVARVVRGNNTAQASFSFWGATLSVSYTVPAGKTYTLTNVQGNHTITIEEAPYYTISTANTYTGATITAPSKIYAGQNGTVSLSVANLYEVVVTDNGTDITSSFNGSNGTYTYALNNVSGNHSISVSEAPYTTVSVVSYYSSVTGSPASQKVYLGRSATITFTGSLTGLVIKDGETDITSSISQSQYTIPNVQAAHTIYIYREANFVKHNDEFKEIRTYYQKVNGSWTTITKVAFETIATANTMSYGGHFSGITSMGEVVEASKAITINDGELQSGTYKLYYEDENGTPLDNYDEITEFTIS